MKKLISMLCIAAVSVTFSYTDIAEAMNNVDEQEMNFVNSNTKSHGRKAKKQKKQKKQRKNKKHKGNQNIVASDSQDEMRGDEDSEKNIQKKPFTQKKNKKRRGSKKNKRNKRNLGRQEEVLYNDAQYDMHKKQGKKRRRSKKKNGIRPINNSVSERDNEDWKDVIALADEHGHVTNPKVNGTMVTVNNTAKAKKVLRKKPAIRITKGLTPHIALGTDTEQLIQPKHNNKRDLKEPIQLRQELERYRKMFAQVPISDETA